MSEKFDKVKTENLITEDQIGHNGVARVFSTRGGRKNCPSPIF